VYAVHLVITALALIFLILVCGICVYAVHLVISVWALIFLIFMRGICVYAVHLVVSVWALILLNLVRGICVYAVHLGPTRSITAPMGLPIIYSQPTKTTASESLNGTIERMVLIPSEQKCKKNNCRNYKKLFALSIFLCTIIVRMGGPDQ
jgi:hypothetical protein